MNEYEKERRAKRIAEKTKRKDAIQREADAWPVDEGGKAGPHGDPLSKRSAEDFKGQDRESTRKWGKGGQGKDTMRAY